MASRYLLASSSHKLIRAAASGGLALRPLSHHPIISTTAATRRNMSSSSPSEVSRPAITTPPAGKYEFLVVVPDKAGVQQKRLEVRAKHFEGIKAHVEAGTYKVGGATLNDIPEGNDPAKWDFHGSTVVMVAASKDEVLEVLRKDIYTTSGVWDVDNAQIWPVKLAFRYP
ncbi:hypothetical protein BKA67DRAFT_657616 [Truncatella angustata]|uniref:YCII-related domain-containing protein n=1 Tax=Truncatella angustata TaxID=152316 RepID=A0A9P8UP63_9PEZI|nr:uncharacterized protein BKA67DRAFT_657616 [Truncatella angustata]KAH6655693.1 hypothetical protein BKA67DRAFT_657616 [Truncatella angustata]KAH8201913.1 hypothetical protein TruAng_003905 [Truncatella angustata]